VADAAIGWRGTACALNPPPSGLALSRTPRRFRAEGSYLAVTHTTMGTLAVLLDGLRLLEPGPAAPAERRRPRLLGRPLRSRVLVFYREANGRRPDATMAANAGEPTLVRR
jgi:hypothetical protein